MRTWLFVAILSVASTASAQDFFTPDRALEAKQYSLARGEHRCFEFSVATSSVVSFMVSSAREACVPVDAKVTIYKDDEEDPTSFLATGKREGRQCAEAERRLGGGMYKVCVAGDLGAAVDAFHLRKTTRVSPSTPRNDTCRDPTVLDGARGRLRGSLLGAHNDHSPIPIGVCKDASRSFGPEVVYAIDIGAGQTLDARLIARGGAPALYLLANCERWWLACVASADKRGPAQQAQDRLRFRNAGASARYFLVVDGRHREAFDFELSWEVR